MALEQHPLEQIVNVHWKEGGTAFLYSGGDGMWGSTTGQTWIKATRSVAAASLAWVDNVWVGCGRGGCWRSEDGADKWEPVAAPAFEEVVAMKPAGIGTDGKPKRGIFAGWLEDEEGDNHIVYTSSDLGKTWNAALTIPTDGGTGNGFEGINGLSGCGGALFVCTIWQSSSFHQGDARIYSSIDGDTFSAGIMVFGPGSTILPSDPDQFPRKRFSAAAVGYDATNKTYIAVGEQGINPSFGIAESYLIYSTFSSPSLGAAGEGTVFESGAVTPSGKQVGSLPSAAGGGGKHVTGSFTRRFGVGGTFIDKDMNACFIPGSPQVLRTLNEFGGGYVGSFCFKGTGEGSTEDGGETSGRFACVSFGPALSGGVYIAASDGGTFVLTHQGEGINVGGANLQPRGAVAVGNVAWLKSET